MPEYIGRTQFNQGLAQQLVQMTAQHSNPIGEAIKSVGDDIADVLKTKQFKNDQEKQQSIAEHGRALTSVHQLLSGGKYEVGDTQAEGGFPVSDLYVNKDDAPKKFLNPKQESITLNEQDAKLLGTSAGVQMPLREYQARLKSAPKPESSTSFDEKTAKAAGVSPGSYTKEQLSAVEKEKDRTAKIAQQKIVNDAKAQAKNVTAADRTLGKAIQKGTLTLSMLPAFGDRRGRVAAAIMETNPDFDFTQSELDYEANKKATAAMNAVGPTSVRQYIDYATKSLDLVKHRSDELTRTGVKFANAAELAALAQTSTTAAQYLSDITDASDAVAKILQGGGTGSSTSDAKLKQAQIVLDSNYSTDQLNGVMDDLRTLFAGRKTALETPSVVTVQRGQKTPTPGAKKKEKSASRPDVTSAPDSAW